jgi:malonyl-CoA O-methyltransferase
MAVAAAPESTRRPVQDAALARVRRRLAAAPEAPWLHREVARRMAERLSLILQRPRTVIDWDAPAGGSAGVLRGACAGASYLPVTGVDAAAAPAAAPWWSPRRWRGAVATRPSAGLPAAAGDLLWSNMGLHWCADPLAEMRRWHEVLAVDGFLMFSTLGPGSLGSLRALYAARGWPPPHAPFVDMHDLGDMLVRAGFADPVMDQETLTLTWPDGHAALRELRCLGGNADPARPAGLRTPRWRDALASGLQPDPAQRPALALEIVYGHAFRPRPRPRVAAETTVGLQDMRSILRDPLRAGGRQGSG